MNPKKLEVAHIVGKKFNLDVIERDGLFWLGPDRVLDVEFSDDLSIPCSRVMRLLGLFADGFRVRIAIARKDGVYIKSIDMAMDGWVDVRGGIHYCQFRLGEDAMDEISPIKKLCAAPASLFKGDDRG